MRLLLVEDHARLASFIERGLVKAGFSVDRVELLEDALAAIATIRYDVVVLDLALPDGDGLEVVRKLRAGASAGTGANVPVLILTARDGLRDRVRGLDEGADDYLLKPFEMEELTARLKALLRRPGSALGLTLDAGNLCFDTRAREVRVGDAPLLLSRREMSLLELLLRRAGRVVPKDVIEESLYGFEEEVTQNSIEVLVHRLRKKLVAAHASPQVHTLRGVGYLLSDEVA